MGCVGRGLTASWSPAPALIAHQAGPQGSPTQLVILIVHTALFGPKLTAPPLTHAPQGVVFSFLCTQPLVIQGSRSMAVAHCCCSIDLTHYMM